MNNRTKIRFLASFLVVLTGLLCLECFTEQDNEDKMYIIVGARGRLDGYAAMNPALDWTFQGEGWAFGLMGRGSITLIVFANKSLLLDHNIFVVAGALVVVPVIYGVAISWIIRLRREMKAQSPEAGSAERPV